MVAPLCDPCCNTAQFSSTVDSYRNAVLQLLCAINEGGGGGGGGCCATYGAAFPATGQPVGGTDGTNFVPLNFDGSGFLKVNVSAGGGAGGTSSTFGAANPATGTASGFSDGTNMREARVFDADTGGGTEYVLGSNIRISAGGGSIEAKGQQVMASSIPVVIASNQTSFPVTIAAGAVTIGDIANITTSVTPGTAAANLGKAEDAATASGDVGVGILFKRLDTAATQTSADGDYSLPVVNSNGQMRVGINRTFQVTDADSILKAEDAASVSGDAAVAIALVRRDALAAETSADGDYTIPTGNQFGQAYVEIPNQYTSQTLDMTNGAAIVTALAYGAQGGLLILIGTWTGGITVESSIDNTTWNTLIRVDPTSASSATAVASSGAFTTNGQWMFGLGGANYVRARVSTVGTGTATVMLSLSSVPSLSVTRIAQVLPGTAALSLGKAEDAASASGDVGVYCLSTRQDAIASTTSADGDYQSLKTDAIGGLYTTSGSLAIAHGANPTEVAAGTHANTFANRAGIPFVMGGHPNIVTIEAAYTAAQTDVAIVTIAAGTIIIVTSITFTCSNANTVNVGVRIGFGTANTPTTTGVLLTHPGIAPGSGVSEGAGSGIIGIGADNQDIRITADVPTTGSMRVRLSYYTIST